MVLASLCWQNMARIEHNNIKTYRYYRFNEMEESLEFQFDYI